MAAIYFKTREKARQFASKRKSNGFPASVVDAGKGWGQLRYSVSLTSIKPVNKTCGALPVRL